MNASLNALESGQAQRSTMTLEAPTTCPSCSAEELCFAEKRRQFKCGSVAVFVGGGAWSQNWPCILPQKRDDAADGPAPHLPAPAAAAAAASTAPGVPALPVVGPVASLEVVEGTPDEPRRVRIAFVGGIGDWQELHAWSKSGRTAEDHIRRTLQQAGRAALPMIGVGAAA